MKEEQEVKQKEEVLLNYMQPHSKRMNQIREQLNNPDKFQPNELFCELTKFALIIANQEYDKEYITLGDLPAVVDDLKKAKYIAKMMGIPTQNTFAIKDASYAQVEERFYWMVDRITVLAKVLVNRTGIKGTKQFQHGLEWSTLKTFALKLVEPFDCVVIDLDAKDQ